MSVSIPETDHPTVSIVIIGWRLGAPLVDAVASVVASVDPPDYEVVVVFNGATEEIRAEFDANVRGAIIEDLGYNTGYGYACNRGAALARGEFLFFLNDDAVVAPETLAVLVESIRRPLYSGSPIGAVAAVLANSDGSLQEAGSRMLPTAGTIQLGAGLSMEQARSEGFLERRSIDYGSGAALLVRAELFRKLGGHDARYRPAYFEDVDLAFRMRAAGYDVILEPSAFVVHASGASTIGDRRFREFAGEHSGRAFIERWNTELAQCPSADDPLDRICPIPRAAPTPAQRPADESPADVALGIARDYEHWLNDALDSCRDSHAGLDAELAHARAEWTRWHDAAQERGARSHELYLRLQDLEQRNLIGIARWRVGIAMRRRAEKRAH